MVRAYFDNNASSPLMPEVLEAMRPTLEGAHGNASSIHQRGQAAKAALEQARANVAKLIGADASEIVFTSGGTESNNLAIRGIVGEWRASHPSATALPHLITSRIEHHSVLNVFEELERLGHPVTYLRAASDGRIEPAELQSALRPDTGLVSIMMANNETGVLQPVAEFAAMARAAKVKFHTDAIQAVAKVPIDVKALGCDLLSLSGHKFHACPGVGALYVRRGVRIQAMLYGGRHERERRAGSENLPGIVSLGAAARLDLADNARLAQLRDRIEQTILASVPRTGVAGAGQPRVPNTTDIYFDGIEGEALVIALDLHGFCVSTGAACTSGAVEPSHVLLAMGYPRARARASLRFSLGHQNTADEVDALLAILPELVQTQRRLVLPDTAPTLARLA